MNIEFEEGGIVGDIYYTKLLPYIQVNNCFLDFRYNVDSNV